jgi:hypothetical protein
MGAAALAIDGLTDRVMAEAGAARVAEAAR